MSERPPGSRTRSLRTCQVLRPRRAGGALALARAPVSPSAGSNASAPGTTNFSRLDGWPMRTPTDASPTPSRTQTHGSGPMRFAKPSSYWTFTNYSLPVSQRTDPLFHFTLTRRLRKFSVCLIVLGAAAGGIRSWKSGSIRGGIQHYCAKPPREPSKGSGRRLENSSTTLRPRNAPTFSPMQAMTRIKANPL